MRLAGLIRLLVCTVAAGVAGVSPTRSAVLHSTEPVALWSDGSLDRDTPMVDRRGMGDGFRFRGPKFQTLQLADFVQDEDLLRRLDDTWEDYYTSNPKGTYAWAGVDTDSLMSGEANWVSTSSGRGDHVMPRNAAEELAGLIVETVLPLLPLIPDWPARVDGTRLSESSRWRDASGGISVAGVEYWSNTFPTGRDLGIHQDKDEAIYWATKQSSTDVGVNIHPILGTIFYPPSESWFEGGTLYIHEIDQVGQINHVLATVAPAPNTLVVFRGDLPHGVTQVRNGTRRSIAVNVWGRTPNKFRDS